MIFPEIFPFFFYIKHYFKDQYEVRTFVHQRNGRKSKKLFTHYEGEGAFSETVLDLCPSKFQYSFKFVCQQEIVQNGVV